MPRITKRMVDTLSPDPARDIFAWDDLLKGFGVRVKPTGAAAYILQYRTPQGVSRRIAFGRVGTLTPEEARTRARLMLVDVADGKDPAQQRRADASVMTIADLCDDYMEAANAGRVLTYARRPKKASTVLIDGGRVERHIKPLIGRVRVDQLTRPMVQRMVDDIAAGKTAGQFDKSHRRASVRGGAGCAARVAGLLGGIWTWAEQRGLVSGVNPTRGIATAADVALDRVLSDEELGRLGAAIEAYSSRSDNAGDMLRLIAMTGLRLTEASGLRWSEVDVEGRSLRLADTKTGPSRRPLGAAAITLLETRRRFSDALVFPSFKTGRGFIPSKSCRNIFVSAGLADVTARDLRRTFASVAAEEGCSDSTIAEMLGHARHGITHRHYIRRTDEILADAADRVAARIEIALKGIRKTLG